MWCWLAYMNPHRLTWGFAYDFPFAAIVAATILLALFFWREPKRIPWTPLTFVWLAFVLWMCFTTLFALVPDYAFGELERTIKIQLMTFVTIMVMTTRNRLNSLVWIIVVSLGFYGIKGGIFTILKGGQYLVFGPEGSFIGGNNSLALALIMTLPLMRYLQLNSNRRWVRYGLGIAMVLSLLSILASYSRGAFLALLAMGVFLWLKSRKKAMLMLLTLTVITVAWWFMPDRWVDRMETIQTYSEDTSVLGRFNSWWFAFNVAKARPFVGGGYDVFFDPELRQRYNAPDLERMDDAHSIYFEVLGEHGFIGLALFLTLGFLALRSGACIIRETKNRKELQWARDLAGMTQTSIVGYASGGAFLGLAYFDFYYHLIAILVITRFLIQKNLREDIASAFRADEDKVLYVPAQKTR
jgi:probable O-glycosylation ligase (exosortase A-associated)